MSWHDVALSAGLLVALIACIILVLMCLSVMWQGDMDDQPHECPGIGCPICERRARKNGVSR